MSKWYENRTKPIFSDSYFPERANNPHIIEWWTDNHDQILEEQIIKDLWYWTSGELLDRLVEATDSEIIEIWKLVDPLCTQYAWYSILLSFASARAYVIGLITKLPEPKWKFCPLCNNQFIENSLPPALINYIGANQIDFCAPCLRDTVLEGGRDHYSAKEVSQYAKDLTRAVGHIPSQQFATQERTAHLIGFSTEERLAILRAFQKKPSLACVKKHFNSWFGALVAAGVLDEDAQRMQRGTRCFAKDGHICLSLGEKTIDDYLFENGIDHKKEVPYPEGNYRADFVVDGIYIEYFGLHGNKDYDEKTIIKRNICKTHGLTLIEIYPKDLTTISAMQKKLAPIFPD